MNLTPEHQALWDAAESELLAMGHSTGAHYERRRSLAKGIQALITELTEARGELVEAQARLDHPLLDPSTQPIPENDPAVVAELDRVRAVCEQLEVADFANASLAIACLLSELERLRGNQRTPGTREVCIKCGIGMSRVPLFGTGPESCLYPES